MTPWLTIAEAARYLNVSKASLRRWTKAGHLACQRVGVRGERRFAVADLEAFLRDSGDVVEPVRDMPPPWPAQAPVEPALLDSAAAQGRVRHVCSHFGDDAESWALFLPYFRDHVQSGAAIFYIYDSTPREQMCAAIAAAGWDAQNLIDRGLLELIRSSEAYLRTGAHAGAFSADGMIAFVAGVIAAARARGHRKMLISGEMTWSLAGVAGADEMIAYEDRLNDLLAASPDVTIVCHYSTERFDAKLTLEALRVHPFVQLPAGLFHGFTSPRSALAASTRPARNVP